MMWNVLHIQSISKKHVSIGHVVDHGMQVCFTNHECFIEEEGQIIAQGRREGRMFILDRNAVGTALFIKGQKVESDIDLWHNQIGHVNYQRF